jgi:hypothetical protein
MAPYEKSTPNPSQYQQYGKSTNYMLSSMASKSENDNIVSNTSVERLPKVDPEYVQAGRRIADVLTKSLGELRPEQAVYEARVTHDGLEETRRSVDSENSRRMIIKKGVEWSVDYDTRNASASGKEDETCALAEISVGR